MGMNETPYNPTKAYFRMGTLLQKKNFFLRNIIIPTYNEPIIKLPIISMILSIVFWDYLIAIPFRHTCICR